MADRPLLSIIITSHYTERMGDIYELLDSIQAQTYPNLETIFIAERSRELYDQIKAYGREKAVSNMRVIFNEGEQGASAARNLGIKQSKGAIIAFIDDDALPFPDWAEEMIKTYKDDSVIGVTGPALPLWKDDSAASWFPEEFYWVLSCTAWGEWNGIAEVRNVWTMNASFKKEAFLLAGYFATSIGPKNGSMAGRKTNLSEDVELSLRLREVTGKRIVFSPDVRVQHRVYSDRLELGYITRWAYWMGYSKHKLKKLYPQTDADPLSQEHQLLKRIITRLLPNIMRTFLTNPVIAWRKLRVTITALFFVALGYYSHLFTGLLPGRKPAAHKLRKETDYGTRY